MSKNSLYSSSVGYNDGYNDRFINNSSDFNVHFMHGEVITKEYLTDYLLGVKDAEKDLSNVQNVTTSPAVTNIIQNNADNIDKVLPVTSSPISDIVQTVETSSDNTSGSVVSDQTGQAFTDGYNDCMAFLSVDYSRHMSTNIVGIKVTPSDDYKNKYYAGYLQAQKDYADNANSNTVTYSMDDSETARQHMVQLGIDDANSLKQVGNDNRAGEYSFSCIQK